MSVQSAARNSRDGSGSGKRASSPAKFPVFDIEARPPIAIKVKNHRAGAEDLPDAPRVLARDAQHHIQKLIRTEALPHHRPGRDVSSLFFRIAHRDRFGQRHNRIVAQLPARREPRRAGWHGLADADGKNGWPSITPANRARWCRITGTESQKEIPDE